jgi:hypothetical protein
LISRLLIRKVRHKPRLSLTSEEEEAEYERQGINPNDRDRTVQDLGSVETREGRLLVFPNVYQHCVSPFELEDKTRPGHRKVLALFMVDPYFPIISTANVPPQQPHWGGDSLRAKLPTELSQMVYDNVDCPYPRSVALKLRDELMEERKALDVVADKAFRHAHWSFCEH